MSGLILLPVAFGGASLPETAQWILLGAALKGGALLTVASLLVTLVLRRASAATRHVVWLSALAAVLALPAASLLPSWRVLPRAMNPQEVPRPPATALTAGTRPSVRPPVPLTSAAPETPAISPLAKPMEATFRAAEGPALPLAASIICLTWLGGVLLLLGPLFISLVTLRRMAARARPVSDGPLMEMLRALQDELHGPGEIRLLLGDEDAMPMVWGILRPRLLLPATATDWPASRLRGVLLHELAHLRRRDLPALLIAQLALAMHWFNPLAWFAVRQLREEQERACDDQVLRHGVRASDYATDLLAVATGRQALPFASGALTMAHPGPLEDRVAGILDAARNRRGLNPWLAVSATLLTAAIALPLAMLRAEEKAPAGEPLQNALDTWPIAAKTTIDGVTTTADTAEINAGPNAGDLAFVIGDGENTRVLIHAFSGQPAAISFRAGADDRQGQWWDQVRVVHAEEADCRFPELPADWLPKGRLDFLPTPTRRADASYLIAEITGPAGRIPVAVRGATPGEIDQAQIRNLPRTSLESEIVIDALIQPLGADAPGKMVILPVMAMRDLAKPREALSFLPMDVRLGFPFTYTLPAFHCTNRVNVTATRVRGGIHLDGTLTVELSDGKYSSAKAAFRSGPFDPASQPPATGAPVQLHVGFSATLGSNDGLVVPIPAEGVFPEKIALCLTALPKPQARLRWKPPGTRAHIQVEGWVLSWPRADQEWFTKAFDYPGIPEMIDSLLKARKVIIPHSVSSEGVGSIGQAELEQLLAAARTRAGVTLERVEPFSVKPYAEWLPLPEFETPILAGGERAFLRVNTDERYISPTLRWETPRLKHLSGWVTQGIFSGTSLCVLLPGPADPEKIRLLMLRFVNPDAGRPGSDGAAAVTESDKNIGK